MSKTVKLGSHSFITKLAGFEHTTHIQHNATHSINDIPLVIGKNVKNGKIIYEFDWYIPKKTSDALPRSVLNKRCIVIPYVGSKLGELAIFENDFTCHLGSNVAKVELTDDIIELDYLYYYLKSSFGQSQLFKDIQGSAQPNITMNSIRETVVVIFDRVKQKKITSILSALDAKIALNNRINIELEAMAKTLYDYWFVQFDFPDAEGKPYKTSGGAMVWSEELKREIPEGWEVNQLSEITDVSNESINPFNFPYKEFKHYSLPSFDATGTYSIEKGEDIMSNKFTVTELDVLVTKLNPWFNRVVFSTEERDLICSTEFVVWRSDNLAMKNYLYMIARDSSFITFCVNSASGTSNSHKRVNPTVMMKYNVAFNRIIAERFGTKIESSIKMYAKNQLENQQLSSLRDWLLPMLMNGQVVVE